MAKKKSMLQQLQGAQAKQYEAFQQMKQKQGGIVMNRNPYANQTAQGIMQQNAGDAQALMKRIAKRNRGVK